ncbi:MAG TPA: hypothetical protein PK771_15645, partial [Spirochaetota bacterium]|nr:hypothetical protein [Spirochaetota bacterium]
KTVKNSSTFANEYCFQYCYDRDLFNPKYAIPIILHETMHIVQASLFSMNNIGMYEGHSTYMQIKYELYSNSFDFTDEKVFDSVNEVVKKSLLEDREYPDKIFTMSNIEFQNVNSDSLTRNPKKRYEICTSFIAYTAEKYGMEKLNKWFYKTDRENFIDNFNTTYNVDFFSFEKEWFIEVLSN